MQDRYTYCVKAFQYLPLVCFCWFACAPLQAARIHQEAYYQEQAAVVLNGKTEVILPNGTRCDILTDKYAVEVDFADKWAEAIGQSLNYAAQTGLHAAIILIIEKPSQEKYFQRLQQVIEAFQLPITLFQVRGDSTKADAAPALMTLAP